MTVKQIQAIVGHSVEKYERDLLAAADARAARFLKAGGAVIMDAESDHYTAFHDVVLKVHGAADVATREATLLNPSTEDVGEAACGMYTPPMSAAYYFGLALGLRLAASSEGGA